MENIYALVVRTQEWQWSTNSCRANLPSIPLLEISLWRYLQNYPKYVYTIVTGVWTERDKETHMHAWTFCPWHRGGSMTLCSAIRTEKNKESRAHASGSSPCVPGRNHGPAHYSREDRGELADWPVLQLSRPRSRVMSWLTPTSNPSRICWSMWRGQSCRILGCKIPTTQGNNRITKTSPSEGPLSMIYQKPEASKQTNNSAINSCQ